MFLSLRHRNARVFFGGLLISNVGTWMQMTALAWLVREQTDSGTALGVVVACQFLPMLVLVPFTGALADRRDRRNLALVCQFGLGGQALALALLDFADHATVPVVAALSLVQGLFAAVENPARRGLVTELVEPAEIPNAMALNTATMTGSRIFGPAVAGMLVAGIGTAWCFLLNAVSFIAIVASLARLDRATMTRVPRAASTKGMVREGAVYVWREPTLRLVIIVLALVGTFAFNYQVALPLLVDDVFHAGSTAFGWMMTVAGVGSVIGSLTVARHRESRIPVMIVSVVIMGAASVGVGFSPNLAVALACCVPLGIGGSAMMASSTGLLNTVAGPEYRSRVLALQTMAFLGSTPIGGPITGWIGDVAGSRWAMAYGGLVALGTAGWAFAASRRSRPVTSPVSASASVGVRQAR